MLHCKARVFPVCMAYGYMLSWPFITSQKMCMHMNLDHVASSHLFLGRHSLQVRLLATGSKYASNVFSQCKTAVPVRRKTCERCDHVFRFKRKAECILREKAMKCMRAVESDSVKSISFNSSGVARTLPLLGHSMGTLRLYELPREVWKLIGGSGGILPPKFYSLPGRF